MSLSLATLDRTTSRSKSDTNEKPGDPAKLLSAQEERTLARRIQQGDRRAYDRLVLANLRLVTTVARAYRDCGLSLDDLKQEGIRGLMRAASNFDPEAHDSRFASFAASWIRHSIRRAIESNGSLIRLPEYIHKLRSKYRRTLGEIYAEELRTADANRAAADRATPRGADPEIASRMGVSLEVLDLIRRSEIERTHFSGESDEGDSISFEETVADRGEPLFDLESHEELECLHEGISLLKPQEAWIIRLRFGFGVAVAKNRNAGEAERPAPRTAKTIARTYGIPLERIQQTEQSALLKLKEHMRKRVGDDA